MTGASAPQTGLSSDDQARSGLGPSGFDPSRIMELFCAVANARYALEYWDRETRWACGGHGDLPLWAEGPAQRGRHECETLRQIETGLRDLITRDSDGSGEAGETAQTGSTEGDSAGAQHIAQQTPGDPS